MRISRRSRRYRVSVGRGLRLRGDPRPRPHRRGADGHRRGEPRRPGRGVLGILDHFARAARRPGPGADRALVERAGARHVLVERAGDHERGRRDRHRALGSEGQARSASRSTTSSAARRATASASTATCAATTAEELVEDAHRWRGAGFTALRYGPLAAFDDHSLARLGSAGGDRRRRSRRPRRCATRSATRSTCCSTRTRCSARRGRLPRPCARAVPALLLRGPDPAAQPALAAARARQGEPADRDRRAARAQVGVPAADRERAASTTSGSTSSTRAGSPRRRRSSRWARRTGSAPRCTTRARR